MSAGVFYVPPGGFDGPTAVLTGDEFRHARVSLRLGAGDRVRLLDGDGGLYDGVLETVSRGQALVRITRWSLEPEPAFALTVAMGILPGERFEWAVQKGTELGAASFIPLLTSRAGVKASRPWKRARRLERVIVSACKQCQRARFPAMADPVALEDLDTSPYDLKVAFWESPDAPPLGDAAASAGRPATGLMVIGPVGGLTEGEAALLKDRGCLLAGLGPRILRTETAAAAGVALLQFLFGDMG